MAKRRPRTVTEGLKKAIAQCGLSQRELAKRSGVPRPAILWFARGDRSLSLPSVDKLARYFELELRPIEE